MVEKAIKHPSVVRRLELEESRSRQRKKAAQWVLRKAEQNGFEAALLDKVTGKVYRR